MDKIEQRVVVTDSQALLEPGIEVAPGACIDVDVLPEGTTGAEAAAKAADAPAAIIGCCHSGDPRSPRCAERAFWSGRASARHHRCRGGDHAGIWVANVPDYCVDEVADHALLLLLSALRRLTELERVWHAGPGSTRASCRRSTGSAGGASGSSASGGSGVPWRSVRSASGSRWWPMTLGRRQRPPAAGAEPVGLDELFATSDAITLHCPLSPETRHLVGADRLSGSSPGSSSSTPAAAASSTLLPSKLPLMTDGSRRWGWTSSTTNRSRT
jgi:phosphoglycerate dehydrogenase-like enzyme